MLSNGNPSLSDIELPDIPDASVTFYTSHSRYALRNIKSDSWHLFSVEKDVHRVTHFIHNRGAHWIASPVDRGHAVRSPDWRDALRRVVV